MNATNLKLMTNPKHGKCYFEFTLSTVRCPVLISLRLGSHSSYWVLTRNNEKNFIANFEVLVPDSGCAMVIGIILDAAGFAANGEVTEDDPDGLMKKLRAL